MRLTHSKSEDQPHSQAGSIPIFNDPISNMGQKPVTTPFEIKKYDRQSFI